MVSGLEDLNGIGCMLRGNLGDAKQSFLNALSYTPLPEGALTAVKLASLNLEMGCYDEVLQINNIIILSGLIKLISFIYGHRRLHLMNL